MTSLIEVCLLNAALATILAILALVVGKIVRRPALTHALWVLVLLKLLTPPLFEMETGVNLEFGSFFSAEENQPLQGPKNDPKSSEVLLESIPLETEPITPTPVSIQPIEIVDVSPVRGNVVAPVKTSGELNLNPRSKSETSISNSTTTSTSLPLNLAPATRTSSWTPSRAQMISSLIVIWLTGAVTWFAIQGVRLLKFFRILRHTKLAPVELQQQTQRLASAMGLRHCPTVRVISGTLSPLMWSLGGKTELLFPAELLNRLDQESRATLIVHELAHYHRGDHWVRLLELCVGGLYWWHPVVWWAKNQLEETEEACCDAWVVSQFSDDPRRYAEALLATVDFLSETSDQIPSVASGIGDARSIRTRLTSIMRGPAPKRLSSLGRVSVLGLAFLLLPLKPVFFGTPAENAEASLSDPELVGTLSVEPLITQPTRSKVFSPKRNEEQQPTEPVPSYPDRELTKEQRLSRIHQGEIWAQTHTRNGERIITATTDRGISFQNMQNNTVVDLSSFEITSVAFSPDGDTFLSGSLDGTVRLWDASQGNLLKSFPGHEGTVRSVIFSPDGELIVSGGEDGTIRVWNLGQRNPPETLSQWTQHFSTSTPVNCIRFSPDGTQLAIASGDWKSSGAGMVHVWETSSLKQLHAFPSETAAGAVSFQPDGKTLVVGSWKGRVTLWHLPTGKPFSMGNISKDTISLAAFSSDLDLLSTDNLPSGVRPLFPNQPSDEFAVNNRLKMNAPTPVDEKNERFSPSAEMR